MARTTKVTVDLHAYGRTYGHDPKNWYGHWMFRIDEQSEPLRLVGTYKKALRQAKALAQYRVTVLP